MSNTIEILLKARDEATKQLQSAAVAASGLTGSLHSLALAAGPMGAVSAALIGVASASFLAAKSVADQVEQLGNLSQQTGVTTQNLQVLQQLLTDAGGSAEDANQAFNFLNRAIATNDPLLKALGITTKDTWTAFNQLVQILAQTNSASDRTQIAFQLLGRGSAALLGKINQIAADLPGARAEFEKLGIVFGEDVVTQAQKLDRELDQLNDRLKGLSNTFKSAFLKPVLDFADFLIAPQAEAELNRRIEAAKKKLFELKSAQASTAPGVQVAFKVAGGEADIAKTVAVLDELQQALAKLKADTPAAAATASAAVTELTRAALRLTQVKVEPGIAKALQADLDRAREILKKGGVNAEQQALALVRGINAQLDKVGGSDAAAKKVADAVAVLAAQFGVSTGRARELYNQLQSIEKQTERLATRDALLKVGVDIDAELIADNLARAQAIFKAAGLIMPVTVTDDIEASLRDAENALAQANLSASVDLTASGEVDVRTNIEEAIADVRSTLAAANLTHTIEAQIAAEDAIARAQSLLDSAGLNVNLAAVVDVEPALREAQAALDRSGLSAELRTNVEQALANVRQALATAGLSASVESRIAVEQAIANAQTLLNAAGLNVNLVAAVDIEPALREAQAAIERAGLTAEVRTDVDAALASVRAALAQADLSTSVEAQIAVRQAIADAQRVLDSAGIGVNLAASVDVEPALRQAEAALAAANLTASVVINAPDSVSVDVRTNVEAAIAGVRAALANANLEQTVEASIAVDAAIATAQKAFDAAGLKVNLAASVDVETALRSAETALRGGLSLELRTNVEQALANARRALAAAKLDKSIGSQIEVTQALATLQQSLDAANITVKIKASDELEPRGIQERATPEPIPIPDQVPFDFAAAKKAQADLLKSAISLREAFAGVGAAWTAVVEDMLQNTAIANEAFGALFNGLQSGFGQVFANLTNEAQTFKSAFVTIINALVQEALAALARIAAAKVFQFVAGLLGGGAGAVVPFAGIVPGFPGFKSTGTAGAGTSSAQSSKETNDLLRTQNELLRASLQQSSGDTYVVSGINSRDLYESIATPGGEFRRANDRILEVAAVR